MGIISSARYLLKSVVIPDSSTFWCENRRHCIPIVPSRQQFLGRILWLCFCTRITMKIIVDFGFEELKQPCEKFMSWRRCHSSTLRKCFSWRNYVQNENKTCWIKTSTCFSQEPPWNNLLIQRFFSVLVGAPVLERLVFHENPCT